MSRTNSTVNLEHTTSIYMHIHTHTKKDLTLETVINTVVEHVFCVVQYCIRRDWCGTTVAVKAYITTSYY